MRDLRYFLLAGAIAGTLLACAITEQVGEERPDEIATNVAGTLDALGSNLDTPVVEATSPDPEISPTQDSIVESPRSIVFTDNQNLWVVELGSAPRQLTLDGEVDRVRISSDGIKIAFTKRSSFENSSELYAINSDGSDERPLLTRVDFNGLYPSPAGTEGFDLGHLSFRPGTHELFFNTLEVFEEIGFRKTDDLFMIDLDTHRLSAILPAGAGGDFVFSPDGNKVAIIRPDSISVVNGDGSDYLPEIFNYAPVITYSEFQYYAQPVWAEDSATIAIALPSEDPLANDVFGAVWQIPANGDPPISLGRIAGDFYFTQVFSNSSLSPHLNRVAFVRELDPPNQGELYIANIDGSEEMLIETGAINWVGWAPDGRHFVYSVDDPTDLIIGVDGGEPLFTVEGLDLRWLSGDKYLLLSGSPGDWRLIEGRIDGSREVISNPGGDFIEYDLSD